MNLRLLVALLFLLNLAFAQDADNVQSNILSDAQFGKETKRKLLDVYKRFKSGSYGGALGLLDKLENNYTGTNKEKLAALIHYWKGVIYNRMQEYDKAKYHFTQSFNKKYRPKDIYYELAQALYAMDELKKSRDLFMRSALKNYRPAVSLYYVAFISQTLREYKTAVKAYRRIETLKDPEKESVIQASKMQIAEIYLTAVDKREDQVAFLQKRVLGEFEEALIFDPDSNLSRDIRRKMLKVKDKYGLLLLKTRNGRPTIFPRFFAKFTQEIGSDTNVSQVDPVTAAQAGTDVDAVFLRSDLYVRRVYYSGNSVSIAPEVRFNFTENFDPGLSGKNDTEDQDNYTYTFALRMAQEHWLWGKPASFLFDIDFNEIYRKLNAPTSSTHERNSTNVTYMIGERFNFFERGESVLRLRYTDSDNSTESSSSTITSLVAEQIVGFRSGYILLLFANYDMTRVETDSFDQNTLAFNMSLITPRIFDYATPTLTLGYSSADLINDSTRGTETTVTAGLRLTRTYSKKYRGNLSFNYTDVQSGSSSFTFDKFVTTVGVEYLF
jgi:tetratricopeptide (TPR) repeat protein